MFVILLNVFETLIVIIFVRRPFIHNDIYNIIIDTPSLLLLRVNVLLLLYLLYSSVTIGTLYAVHLTHNVLLP